MHFTYGHQHVYANDMIHERPSHTKELIKKKILLLHWKVCFKYLFYLGTVCIINNYSTSHVGYEMIDSPNVAHSTELAVIISCPTTTIIGKSS